MGMSTTPRKTAFLSSSGGFWTGSPKILPSRKSTTTTGAKVDPEDDPEYRRDLPFIEYNEGQWGDLIG